MKTTPYRLGWTPSLPDRRDYPLRQLFDPVADSALPPTIRLPFMPMPLDQLTIGTCVHNAVANAGNFCRQKQRSLNAFHPSRLFPYYVSREQKGWQNWDSGDYVRDAIKVYNSHGSLPEDEWPYDVTKFAEKPPEWCYTSAALHKSIEYYRIDVPGLTDLERIRDLKACIASGFPVVIGFSVYSNFPWQTNNGFVPMPERGDWTMGGHAVLLVGYDDGAHCFQFLNSWGQGWGKLGRGSFLYEYLGDASLASDFWTIRSVV